MIPEPSSRQGSRGSVVPSCRLQALGTWSNSPEHRRAWDQECSCGRSSKCPCTIDKINWTQHPHLLWFGKDLGAVCRTSPKGFNCYRNKVRGVWWFGCYILNFRHIVLKSRRVVGLPDKLVFRNASNWALVSFMSCFLNSSRNDSSSHERCLTSSGPQTRYLFLVTSNRFPATSFHRMALINNW